MIEPFQYFTVSKWQIWCSLRSIIIFGKVFQRQIWVYGWGLPAWRRNKLIVKQKKLKSGHGPYKGPDTKTNRPTYRRSQYNLNLRDCTANYRPVFSSERAPCMKKKEGSNCHYIWSSARKGGPTPRRTDRLTLGRNILVTWTRTQRHCTMQLVWGHGLLLVWVYIDVPLCMTSSTWTSSSSFVSEFFLYSSVYIQLHKRKSNEVRSPLN
jgi:hypothetical protein